MKKLLTLLFVSTFLSLGQISCTNVDYDPFAIIKVTVIDDSTGLPIQGANVALTPPVKPSHDTDDDGQYEFSELDPNNYTVRVSKNGYSPDSKSVNAISGKAEIVSFRLKKEK